MGLLFVPESTSDHQDSRGILFESVNLVELGGAHNFVIFFFKFLQCYLTLNSLETSKLIEMTKSPPIRRFRLLSTQRPFRDAGDRKC